MLEEYLRRVGLSGQPELLQLVEAHLCSIPFENLDVLCGVPIPIDIDSVFAQLVGARRGGYCFQQNRLFREILERSGREVLVRAARVRRGVHEVRPKSHMLLETRHDGEQMLVDVGFGAEGPRVPVPFTQAIVEGSPGLQHQLVPEGPLWVLQSRHDGGDWLDLYAFERRDALPVDFEMYNYYTSTHPRSLFTNSMLVSLHTPDGYVSLFDGLVRIRSHGTTHEHRLHSPQEVVHTLRERFHLDPPDHCPLPMGKG